MLKLYFKILFILLLVNGVYAQDAALTVVLGPENGCDLANDEVIHVKVANVGPVQIFAGSITMNYTVNGSAPISQVLGNNIAVGATWDFSFNTKADLSACNTDFNIVTWFDFPADVDHSNDTLAWTVRNDCTIVPGQVESSELVCDGDNSNTLNLTGMQYGTITNWVFSEDNGSTWTSISNTSTSHIYNDLTDETQFAVELDGGHCPDATSGVATITIQPLPVGGTLAGPTALCISSATGSITLSGNSANVLDWESSTDNGATWAAIGNTTTTENFTGLTQTTLYRALIDGGVCPDAYSGTHEVFIEAASSAGVLANDTTLCENEALNLILGSSIGNVDEWESSSDGVTWTPIVITNPTATYNTGSMTSSTYYRVSVVNGICPAEYSNEVFVQVQPDIVAGTISGGTATCASNASGTLTLTGNTGNVIGWESSVDGGLTWVNIANVTTTEAYTNLSQTTWYRALIEGTFCADKYTDTAYITVSPTTVAGVVSADTLICEGQPYTLNVTGNVGTVAAWQSSPDGNSWTTLNGNNTTHTISAVNAASYYRVIIKSGICDEDTSNVVFVDLLPAPTANAGVDVTILEGDSVELNGSGGFLGLWSADPTLSDSTIYNPIASPTETTTYYLTVISTDGCFDSDFVTVTVGPPIPPLDVKNVITPNNDGFNDTWIIEGSEAFSSMSVKVYNIYGVLVFEDNDYKNDWGGKFDGKALPNGTYLYIVMPGETESVLKGNLTILGDE